MFGLQAENWETVRLLKAMLWLVWLTIPIFMIKNSIFVVTVAIGQCNIKASDCAMLRMCPGMLLF